MNRPEPAAIAAALKEAISALIKVIVVFGIVQMTTEQFGVLMIAVDALLAVVMVLFLRPQITPVASPQVPAGTNVQVTNSAGDVTEIKKV